MIVVCSVLWWFKCICNYQPNPYSLLYLWPSIKQLASSMTLQQKIDSSVPWKPQEGFVNLQLNMASNHQLHRTSGPNTKTQVQSKTSCTLGVHQSFQIVGNSVTAGSVELCQWAQETISTDCTWYHDEYQWTHSSWCGCRCRIPSAGCKEGPISLCTPEEEEDCMGQWIQGFWCSRMVEFNMVRWMLYSPWWQKWPGLCHMPG